MHDVLIIGAGIGGIAAAARLAKLGYRVRVLEKTGAPGGRVALMKRDGYTFDMGATLFLMPQTYAQTYADLGERMEDHLDLRRVEPNYRVHFHDDTYLDITPKLVEMREQMEAEETLMPTDYRDVWNLARGTAFGLSHNVLQVGYLRPQNRHRRYGNLYFVGSSTHPGTGVPIVLISAALVEQRIRKEHPAPARAVAVTH